MINYRSRDVLNDRYRPVGVLVLIAGGVFGWISIASSEDTVERWYTTQQVSQGQSVFTSHCAACHGERAEGTTEWRKTDANGNYPPPPLNGTAHAWHHPRSVLEQTIAQGGIAVGGVMPGFAETLSREEMQTTIAYFQSFWPDEIYTRWQEIDSR